MSHVRVSPYLETRARTEEAAMKVFVAGASGALGRRLVPLLVERGHVVVNLMIPSLEAVEAAPRT
jgi:hypothetical protein